MGRIGAGDHQPWSEGQAAFLMKDAAAVIEDGGLPAKLIRELDEESAEAAEETLSKSILEEYLRTPLIEALRTRFPALRKTEESPLYV